MKDKIKLLSIAAVFVLLICAGYSILSFKQTDLQSILKKESSKKDLFIDHNESRVCSIQYEAKDNRTEKIYFEFADKYIFDMEFKFSVYYDDAGAFPFSIHFVWIRLFFNTSYSKESIIK